MVPIRGILGSGHGQDTGPSGWVRSGHCQETGPSGWDEVDGARALRPLVHGEQFDRTETLRRQALGLDALGTIARLMESLGAPTKPE